MISIANLRKSFGSALVIEDMSLAIPAGCITCIVGPSGSGKTTLLNIVADLVSCDAGAIDLAAGNRLGYMLQQQAMLPWRTLWENAQLGLEIEPIQDPSVRARVLELFKQLDLEQATDKYPAECSTGMQQRAALVRTLAIQPNILLLDEPFASLDYDVKLRAQIILARYVTERGAAVLLVTHDLEDAIAMADRVVVISTRPATIKADIKIDLGIGSRDPIAARTAPKFREYFETIWGHLKYLPA